MCAPRAAIRCRRLKRQRTGRRAASARVSSMCSAPRRSRRAAGCCAPSASCGRGSRSACRTSSTTFAGWRRSNAGGLTRSNWRADWLPLEGGARPPRRKKPAAGSKYAPLHKSCNVRSPIFDEIRHESEVSRRSHRESVILRGPLKIVAGQAFLRKRACLRRPRLELSTDHSMSLHQCCNFHDFRKLARRRLPAPIFNYIDGAADDEVTYRRNTESFERCDLVPNVLRGVDTVDLSVTIMGQKLAMPVYCSPTALQRLFHPEGERAVAAAAAKLGTMFGVSSLGTVSLEEVRNAYATPQVYQFYFHKDRGLNRAMMQRAKEANVDVM